jgi:hypothetical protein
VSTQESEAVQASGAGQPSEDEVRAAYEAELSRITSADMVLQATVSLLNIGARRLGLVGGTEGAEAQQASTERDLEQVRDAIDGARGLLPVLERREDGDSPRSLRDALSALQFEYVRLRGGESGPGDGGGGGAGGSDEGGGGSGVPTPPAPQPPDPGDDEGGPGPAQRSGRLWVPGQ